MCSWLAVAVYLGGIIEYADLLALLLLYISLICVGFFAIFVSLNNKIVITPEGINVPWRLLFEMQFSIRRPWKELSQILLQDGQLLLNFGESYGSHGKAMFKLDGFKSSDLKDFIIAVHSNSPTTSIELDLLEPKLLGMNHLEASGSRGDLTFTSLWEKDLANRFASTAFIPLEVGAELQNGDYKIIGQMSFGGLSAVYLCRHKNQETVVLKEAVVPINSDAASREKALEMFKRETHILKGIFHPHIARVKDHFVERSHDYLVLEHIDGVDLRAYVSEHGPQAERMIIRWAAEIADILQYLHEHSPPIIHRDVTPDNLVIDRTGALKLIDFGAANEFVGAATGTLIGKQAYIAPEQFRGKALPQSDIYSLGCTLYYLATGEDPEPLSESSLPPAYASSMPALNTLIQSCTQIEVSDRLLSMEAVKNCIQQRSETAQ